MYFSTVTKKIFFLSKKARSRARALDVFDLFVNSRSKEYCVEFIDLYRATNAETGGLGEAARPLSRHRRWLRDSSLRRRGVLLRGRILR